MKWIKVSDRLPNDQDVVLIYSCEGIDILQYIDEDWYHYEEGNVNERNITHWMQLPEPPNN